MIHQEIKNYNDLSKESLEKVTSFYSEAIEKGQVDPLEVHLKAKYFTKLFGEISKLSAYPAITEAEKYKDKSLMSCEFSVRNLPDKHDLMQDEEYARLHTELKARESLLKDAIAAKKKGTAVVDGNGEIIEAPPMVSVYT